MTLAALTYLVLDIDPARGGARFTLAVRAAFLVRQALADSGLAGAVKTSGSKGVHVPRADRASAVGSGGTWLRSPAR